MTTINMAEFLTMSDEDQEALVTGFMVQTELPPSSFRGSMQELDGRIKDFEATYGMPSNVMRNAVDRGSQPETAEVCEWMLLDKVRQEVFTTSH